jgi:hypothetical protein
MELPLYCKVVLVAMSKSLRKHPLAKMNAGATLLLYILIIGQLVYPEES